MKNEPAIAFLNSTRRKASAHAEASACFGSTASFACRADCIGSNPKWSACWYRNESSRWLAGFPARWADRETWGNPFLSVCKRTRNTLRDLPAKSTDTSKRKSGTEARRTGCPHWPILPNWKSATWWTICGFSSYDSWERLRMRFLSTLRNIAAKSRRGECEETESNSWTIFGGRLPLPNSDCCSFGPHWTFASALFWFHPTAQKPKKTKTGSKCFWIIVIKTSRRE